MLRVGESDCSKEMPYEKFTLNKFALSPQPLTNEVAIE